MEPAHRAPDGRICGLTESTIEWEIDELARTHRALWLAEVLPPGECVLWGGGAALATVLAAQRDRSVLLIEPRPGQREDASRRAGPGVLVQGPEALTEATSASSLVVVARPEDPVDGLDAVLTLPVSRTAPLAVVVDVAGEAAVVGALERADRDLIIVRNEVRLASTVALADGAPVMTAGPLPEGPPGEAAAVLVLVGIEPTPSVRLGIDAGPAAWWSDTSAIRETIQQLDEELQDAAVERERELRAVMAELEHRRRDAETRLAELQASTSWRITAPLRRASDVVRRR